MRRYLIYALAIVAVVSCKKDDSQTYIESGDNIVSFSSSNTITRTTQMEQDGQIVDAWESGDRVGITTIGFSSDYENVEYEATTSQDATTTSFTAVDSEKAIYYPLSESGDVSFYGHYPYSSLSDEGLFNFSVADQADDLGSVDFMTATSLKSYGSESTNGGVSLEFSHALSKVIFNINIREEVTDFTDLKVTLKDIYSTASYTIMGDQVDGSHGDLTDIEATSVLSDDMSSAIVTAILHPSESTALGSAIELDLSSRKFTVAIDEPLMAGYIHTFTINVGKESAEPETGSTITPWDSNYLGETSPMKVVWDGESMSTDFNGVEYSDEVDNYTISTGEDLALLSYLTTDELYNMEGKTFTMTNSIDLGSHDWWVIGDFSGTFDGGGYRVRNLYVNQPDNWRGTGLFSTLTNGTIKNLNVVGSITADGCCAGIVGIMSGGTVESSSFSGSLTSTWCYVGGIAGQVRDGALIDKSYNSGTISSIGGNCECTGGIAGYLSGSYIANCYNIGSVTSESDQLGGIAGHIALDYNDVHSLVKNCYNLGDVYGTNELVDDTGGIVGLCSDSQIESTYNMGSIGSDLGCTNVGGIAGRAWVCLNTSSYCGYSYNVGTVKGGYLVGGVMGSHSSDNNDIVNCCAQAEIGNGYTADDGTCIVITSDAESQDHVTNVGSLSESEMKSKLLTEFLTNGDWIEDSEGVNGGYPILKDIDYN